MLLVEPACPRPRGGMCGAASHRSPEPQGYVPGRAGSAERETSVFETGAGSVRVDGQFFPYFKGRGVFATEAFRKGDFVLEYRGNLLKQDSPLHWRHYDDTEAVFLFDFQWKGKSYCLDASVEDKSLGRLVNDDNKKPNCKMKTIDIGEMPHLCLFAIKDITPGEEVTYNYGDADWPWRKQKLSPDVSEQIVDESDRPQTPGVEPLL
ncbi:N-lysine methyltransferase KMT5A-like [Epinephelus lanceolatus]